MFNGSAARRPCLPHLSYRQSGRPASQNDGAIVAVGDKLP